MMVTEDLKHFNWNKLRGLISWRAGLAGAVIMGAIVWVINIDHGNGPAAVAALKQALYTFLLGGLLIRMLEIMALRIRRKNLAIVLSALAVSLLTILLVFAVHSMKGTPEPFLSTLPTILLAPPGFAALALRKRNQIDKNRAEVT